MTTSNLPSLTTDELLGRLAATINALHQSLDIAREQAGAVLALARMVDYQRLTADERVLLDGAVQRARLLLEDRDGREQ